jgi:four helix bundle protein
MDDATMDAALEVWSAQQPDAERADPIWSLLAYRFARFALDSARTDLKLVHSRIEYRTRDQLARAITSISANIGEGYSRMSAAERARFFTFALGSTREAISWYTNIADLLPPGTASDRVTVLSRIRRLLLGLIRRGPPNRWAQRKRSEPPKA